jgi:zinc transport system substrate-binding protein
MIHRKKASLFAGLAGALALAYLSSGCSASKPIWDDVPGGNKRVLVSFPPLYCFVKSVAGPDAKVLSLLSTVGPHDYQPNAADSLKVRKADLFFINGLGLDEFVTKLVNSSGNRTIKVVEVGEAIPDKQLLAVAEEEPEHKGAKDEHHHHGDHDPHVWLGLPEAVIMVQRIRDELIGIDPEHKDGYTKRADNYIKELEGLREHGRKVLADKKNPRLIATHDSLRYFARSFQPEAKLEIVGNIQINPGLAPDAAKLKELTAVAKKFNIRVLAVEPQYAQAPIAAETLIREMGPVGKEIQIIENDPLETVPAAADLDEGVYVRKMKSNIDTLAKALR